jgi:hypothetical protein
MILKKFYVYFTAKRDAWSNAVDVGAKVEAASKEAVVDAFLNRTPSEVLASLREYDSWDCILKNIINLSEG